MGLSASQARLISLEARMSDVEYEGQQINQQRLVLSNKMNEIQERVYNMDVPTPPSKQDFMYDVYTGKTRGGKPVKVTINGDGSLNVAQTKTGTIVTKGDMVYVTNGTVVNSTTTKVDGQTVNVPKGMELRTKDVTLSMFDSAGDLGRNFTVTVPGLKHEEEYCTDQDVLRALAENKSHGNYKIASGKSTFTPTDYFFGDPSNPQRSKVVDGKTVVASSTNCDFKNYAPTMVETGNLIEDPNNRISVVISKEGTIEPSSYQIDSGYVLPNDAKNIIDQTCQTQGGKEYKVSDMPEIARTALTDQGLEGLNWWFKDANCTQKFTFGDVCKDADTYQLKSGVKRYNYFEKEQTEAEKATEVADGETTVAGKKIMTIDEVTTLFGRDGESSWSKCLSGLEQTMGTYNSKEGKREFDKNAWRVIVTTNDKNQTTFSFVKAEDLAKGEGAQIQEYVTEQGDYEEDPTTVKANDPNVEYDPDTGHITKIKVDGQDIIMMYGQECNENEYEKAHNKYLYMKSLYDQEQNELNKQTSIYQRQDKQLELKLTRLDTERNSLNTEIEAVKKVIQDAAEDFKTFSG